MKYYELDRGNLDTTKYCEPRFFGEWEGEFLWMNLWENRELKLPVTMSVKNKYNPGDYPLADSKLVSQKLLDVIKQIIICTEIAKDMIEAAGIKDVDFTELPVE